MTPLHPLRHRSSRARRPLPRGLLPLTMLCALPGPLALAETATGSAAGAATAAETAPAAATLPPIEVTATKSDSNPFWMPESISVVTREGIETRQPTRLGDVLNDLPNVGVGGGPRGIGQTLTIRGVGDESIVFLLDGARQNFQAGHDTRLFVDPSLLRQVEVLRGPASALWGSGAIGGVVALSTVNASDLLRPGENKGARVRVGYQDVDTQWNTGVSGYGLVGEQFELLGDLSFRNAGDTRLGTGETLDNSAFESTSGLGKLVWRPAAGHQLTASVLFFDEDGEVPSNPQTIGTPDDLVDRETGQYNGILRWDFQSPTTPLIDFSALLYGNAIDITERRLVDQRHDETQLTTLGFDLRNVARFSAPASVEHAVVVGIDGFRDEASAERDGVPRPSFPDASQALFGVYLQDEIDLFGRVTLVPGLRWDQYESEASGIDANDQSDSALSAKLGLTVTLTDWLALVGAYNEAFRAPSLTQLFVSGVHFTCGRRCANLFVPNPNLEPEMAHNAELGLRAQRSGLFAAGDTASLRFNAFENNVDDFIDQIVIFTLRPVPGNPGAGGISRFDNVRDARLTGFEAELDYDHPRGYARIAYGQTRGDNLTTNEPLGSVQPDAWDLTLALRWPAQALTFGARAQLIGAQNRVPPGVEPSSAYDLYDLFLTWQPPMIAEQALRIDLGVNNLTDRAYLPYLSAIDGPGRNIMATLAWRF